MSVAVSARAVAQLANPPFLTHAPCVQTVAVPRARSPPSCGDNLMVSQGRGKDRDERQSCRLTTSMSSVGSARR
eukprot:1547296-Rhodomonas_salina.5